MFFLLLKFVILSAILFTASYFDVRNNRIVPDKVWMIGFGFGVPVVIVSFIITEGAISLIIPCAFSILIMCLVCFFLNCIRKVGGADIKALLLISVLFPVPYIKVVNTLIPFPLVVLFFTAILSLFVFLPQKKQWRKEIPMIPFITISFIGSFIWIYV